MKILKIIYSCYYGCFLSPVAAYIHLRQVDQDEDLDILTIPGFGIVKEDNLGRIKLQGKDSQGRRVFTMGTKSAGNIVERCFEGFSEIYCLEPFLFVNLSRYNNIFISIGTFLSRRLSRNIGNRIVAWGIKRNLKALMVEIHGSFKEEP